MKNERLTERQDSRSGPPQAAPKGRGIRICLVKPHTHAGKRYPPGERLDLDETSAKWLIELKVAKAATPEPIKQPSRRGD